MKLKYQSKFHKKTAFALAVIMLLQTFSPVAAWALTSGPTQPEVQSFEPLGTTQMVDLFSGDFNYNIPLLEVPGANGGYPINLFYNSVTNIDEEASMVGLGWNIGIGALTNNVRGLPDALNGDIVRRKTDMKKNWTMGLGAGVNFELFGGDLEKGIKGFLSLGLGMKFLYNSYKGFGYSLDPGLSINMGNRNPSASGLGVSTGFGFSLNSLEGSSVNADVSITKTIADNTGFFQGRKVGSLGLGLSMSGREGLKNLTISASSSTQRSLYVPFFGDFHSSKRGGGSNTYTFSNSAYTPQVELPYGGTNISIGAKFGPDFFGGFPSFSVSGFFSGQWLKKRNSWVQAPAYGYMHSQNAYRQRNSLMDFNREKDATIYPEQPNLAIPIATPDILSVAGHGLGGSYRAYRSDWGGIFVDPEVKNKTAGGAIGVEFGTIGVSTHVGYNGEINWSKNESVRPFTSVGNLKFYDAEKGKDFEPYYYKAMGESTVETDPENLYNNMGGDMPIQLERNNLGFGTTYKNKSGDDLGPNIAGKRGEGNRKPRTNSIQPITNKELLRAISETESAAILPEYAIGFYDNTVNPSTVITEYNPENLVTLERDIEKEDRIAGYTVLNNGGSKWNYALPVLNNIQYQASFSVNTPSACTSTIDISKSSGATSIDDINYKVNNTDEYKDIVETPAYAHAHLLTSVLGTDYIDADDIPGPSDGDQGYWMRVEYVKTSNNYIWKTPFNGATFLEGFNSKDTDDKATFLAGDREQYYPGRIVTNTHVAEFQYEQRKDSRGAGNILQNENDALGDYSFQLNKILLFSKIEQEQNTTPQPIKTVHFEYTNELCPGVDNNADLTFSGKLTLKKVWFTYEQSDRGELSPYTFEYNNQEATSPAYDEYMFDRWGVYRESTACENINEPYVKQFDLIDGVWKDNGEVLDKAIASWHLTDIFLPSGSKIHVDLGRDHYAYVQDRTAAQMFKISRFGGSGQADFISQDANPGQEQRKVFFRLEKSIETTGTNDHENPLILKQLSAYTEDLFDNGQGKQLFFKINSDLTNHQTPALFEDVSGYAEIVRIGVDGSCLDANGDNYLEAYIELKPFPIQIRDKDYHPMLVSNWQYLKTNLPDQMFGYNLGSYPNTKAKIVNKTGQLAGMLSELIGVFKNYYKHCKDKNYGRQINLDQSFVRLNTPDKKKYGGGVRVNKVTMSDTYWGGVDEAPPAYGVVYEYEIDEEIYDPVERKMVPTGNKISSGVAANEPSIGREECALRYSKSYKNEVKGRPDNMFSFEYPVNESYYPGPSIGYSKVSVKSLASDYAMKRALGNLNDLPEELPDDLPEEFAVSGMTVNEFYTAKDFPIVTEETKNDHKKNNLNWIPVPLIGDIRIDKYAGTQGYMIELNDMHGKPKSVSSYAQDKAGFILEDPVSSVAYEYQEKDADVYTIGGKQRLRHRLDNMVTVLKSDKIGTGNKTERSENAELGVERELFTDVRETNSKSISGGIDFNSQFFLIGGFPIPWVNFSSSTTKLKTAVTNKVIRRSGILKKVIASDGKSKVITDNVYFDQYTGQPLLTTVNNSFDEKIYNYSIPGHFAYEQMGPAYQNWGLKFTGTVGSPNAQGLYPVTSLSESTTADLLKEGDEFIVGATFVENLSEDPFGFPPATTTTAVTNYAPTSRATFIRKNTDNTLLFALDEALTGEVHFNLVRSGNRNHLQIAVGSIASLQDPTENRTQVNCTIPAPCGGEGIGSLTSNCTTNINGYTVDDVINSSAVTYSKTWIIDDCVPVNPAVSPNPYSTGEAGIWRPYRSYAFVKDRAQSNGVDVSQDGTYTLDVFDWSNPLLTNCTDWRMVEETTKYGPQNQALEGRNVLDIYNAALYGYNDYLPTAVAANARYNEIGFESFEEYDLINPTVQLEDYVGRGESGNIHFNVNPCLENDGEIYSIAQALTFNSSGIILDKPFESGTDPNKAIVNLFNLDTKKEYVMEFDNIALTAGLNDNTHMQINMDDLWDYVPNAGRYAGHVSLLYSTQVYVSRSIPQPEVYLVEEGHTGKQSLMLADLSIHFDQPSLKLKEGKSYVLSAWVKVQAGVEPLPTYDDGLTGIKYGTSDLMRPSGPIIEDWQRIEEVFVMGNNTNTLILHSRGNPTYYDDIRIYPLDGGIQTYVYDKANYRVTEVLDNNNYFTRYKYDSEGNLISVQKETEEGLRTIQESGSYARINE